MKLFLRTTLIGTVISLNIIFGCLAVTTAYENIMQTAYGEYKKAVELTDDGIRILDYIIEF